MYGRGSPIIKGNLGICAIPSPAPLHFSTQLCRGTLGGDVPSPWLARASSLGLQHAIACAYSRDGANAARKGFSLWSTTLFSFVGRNKILRTWEWSVLGVQSARTRQRSISLYALRRPQPKPSFVTLREGARLDDVSGSQTRVFKQFQSCSLHKCGSGEPGNTDVGPQENLWKRWASEGRGKPLATENLYYG